MEPDSVQGRHLKLTLIVTHLISYSHNEYFCLQKTKQNKKTGNMEKMSLDTMVAACDLKIVITPYTLGNDSKNLFI